MHLDAIDSHGAMMLSGVKGQLLRPVAVFALGSLMTQRIVAVIDNDPSLLKALNRLLIAHGYVVYPFSSGEAFRGGSGKLNARDKWNFRLNSA
jgi:hypothetical protein